MTLARRSAAMASSSPASGRPTSAGRSRTLIASWPRPQLSGDPGAVELVEAQRHATDVVRRMTSSSRRAASRARGELGDFIVEVGVVADGGADLDLGLVEVLGGRPDRAGVLAQGLNDLPDVEAAAEQCRPAAEGAVTVIDERVVLRAQALPMSGVASALADRPRSRARRSRRSSVPARSRNERLIGPFAAVGLSSRGM